MNYKLYKLHFSTGVHLGTGMLNDSIDIVKADTLFSAMCIEALKLDRLEELYNYAKNNEVILSDTMPYIDDLYLLPKPMLYVEGKNAKKGDSVQKKKIKNMKYIPADKINQYLDGDIDDIDEVLSEKYKSINQEKLGYTQIHTRASISRLGEDTTPYHIGVYNFSDKCGLYVIVGYQDEKTLEFVRELLISVGYIGIGGKKSSGLGKFTLSEENNKKEYDLPQDMLQRLQNKEQYKKYMSLSVSLPKDEELEQVLEKASYLIEKRSGFVYSYTFANEQRKKKDLYVFSSGSCFEYSYVGDVYDVAENGSHPVYKYAKAMLMGV